MRAAVVWEVRHANADTSRMRTTQMAVLHLCAFVHACLSVP